jgi:hypothetical protein
MKSNGYDAAKNARGDDDLDRWRLAAEIVDVVLSTDPDWSARIGVFGKWGDGKTTVLRFAEHLLREKKNIVFWFNPWAVQNWNDLWLEFGNRLSAALSDAGIPIDDSWLSVPRNSTKWLETKGVAKAVKVGAALLGRDKAADLAFGMVSEWLKLDGPQIQAIQKRAKTKGKRLVVLIDDLDRCSPDLLPKLLLSLRELLDLPGLTFLLAFDDDTINRTLLNINPAWSSGSDFLEKILDFRFYLPPITDEQKQRLVLRALSRYCPFVPLESVAGVKDLLPNGPRSLKTLIRSMATLRSQILRHDSDELNWGDLWLAQMIRLESPRFLEELLISDAFDREIGPLYRLLKGSKGQSGKQEKDQGLERLFNTYGTTDQSNRSRLRKLIDAARARASPTFKYACQITSRPHAVTWREFRHLFRLWSADPLPRTIFEWVAQHSADSYASLPQTENEVFESIMNQRQLLLSDAAGSTSTAELDAKLGEAEALLKMAEQFLLAPGKFSVAAFKRLYDQISAWIGFTKNERDQLLRNKEKELLLKLLSLADPLVSTDLFECMSAQGMDIEYETRQARSELREMSLRILGPKVAQVAVQSFATENGINRLSEGGRHFAVKYCLFEPQSPLWTSTLRRDLYGLIAKGTEDLKIYSNVRDFFNLLVQGLVYGIDSIRRESISQLLKDEELVQVLWRTMISRGIQYRMRLTLLNARQSLIEGGALEVLLPLTDDLRARAAEEESQKKTEPTV